MINKEKTNFFTKVHKSVFLLFTTIRISPLFVPRSRGSLDFARDDVLFLLKKVLEKTLFSSRHFDQVKRVEKSPKAERYCTTILLSPCLLQSIFSLFTLIFPYFTQITKQFGNQTSAFLSLHSTSHLFSPFVFYLPLFFFMFVIICYIYKFLLFYFYQFSTSVRGSLDFARDDGK